MQSSTSRDDLMMCLSLRQKRSETTLASFFCSQCSFFMILIIKEVFNMNKLNSIRTEAPSKDIVIGYVCLSELAAITGASERSLKQQLIQFQEYIDMGRYSHFALIQNQRIIMINLYAFLDYIHYKDLLKNKVTRKTVPAFNAAEIAKLCHPLT